VGSTDAVQRGVVNQYEIPLKPFTATAGDAPEGTDARVRPHHQESDGGHERASQHRETRAEDVSDLPIAFGGAL
jgi:hypothetical protein